MVPTAQVSATNAGIFTGENVPESMADALSWDDPAAALQALALASDQAAEEAGALLSRELSTKFASNQRDLPLNLQLSSSQQPSAQWTAVADRGDSIWRSLVQIASGGSAASREIQKLETAKQRLDDEAVAVQWALDLRAAAQRAHQSHTSQSYPTAAQALLPYLDYKKQQQKYNNQQQKNEDEDEKEKGAQNQLSSEMVERVAQYAGDYILRQLEGTLRKLQTELVDNYQTAVRQGDLQAIGKYTPLLGMLQLESQAVQHYLEFLQGLWKQTTDQIQAKQQEQKSNNSGPTMNPTMTLVAKFYNAAVSILRHHLPMVSQCLHKASGDVAVVQWMHAQVQEAVLPPLEEYSRGKSLDRVARQADELAAQYGGSSSSFGGEEDWSATVMATALGSLPDVDASCQEMATLVQHAESYLRFCRHACQQVSQARKLRGTSANSSVLPEDDTPLHVCVAELGNHYASIERCLLLASLHRALHTATLAIEAQDPRHYKTLVATPSPGSATEVSGSNSKSTSAVALSTTVTETCWYAARRSLNRALATGHAVTARDTIQYVSQALNSVSRVLLARAQDNLHVLSQNGGGMFGGALGMGGGDGGGLLGAAGGLFGGGGGAAAAGGAGAAAGSTGGGAALEGARQRQEVERHMAMACAHVNDIVVAKQCTEQLERVLSEAVQKGYQQPFQQEHLRQAQEALEQAREGLEQASKDAIQHLEQQVLRSRIRSIVSQAISGGASTGTGSDAAMKMLGSSSSSDSGLMNYNLDEEGYNQAQLGDGYVNRLLWLLDELLDPLEQYLEGNLWDTLLLAVLNTVSKRLESVLKQQAAHSTGDVGTQSDGSGSTGTITNLGAFQLDADVRDLWAHGKSKLHDATLASSQQLARHCPGLARLMQIGKLLCVDDLDDVLDLVASSRRKQQWDLKHDDTVAILCLRTEFDNDQVASLLRQMQD